MRAPDRTATRVLVLAGVVTLLALGPAKAQVSANLSLQSDYRVRGVSVTDREPALSLNLSDDLESGVYFGGSAIAQHTSSEGLRQLGHTEYLGFARRARNGVAWDVGVSNQDLEIYASRGFHLKYTEVYAGLSNGSLSSHIYYSPNYVRNGVSTLYLDLNGVWRPADNWRVSSHAGIWRPLDGWSGSPNRRQRYDVRVDLVRQFRRGEISLGWTTATPAPQPDTSRSHGGLVVGATAFF